LDFNPSYRFLIWLVVAALCLTAGLAISGCAKDEGKQITKAHHEAAASLMAKNDFNGAIQEYTQAIEANPKSDLDSCQQERLTR
jgi:hypothetical protein